MSATHKRSGASAMNARRAIDAAVGGVNRANAGGRAGVLARPRRRHRTRRLASTAHGPASSGGSHAELPAPPDLIGRGRPCDLAYLVTWPVRAVRLAVSLIMRVVAPSVIKFVDRR